MAKRARQTALLPTEYLTTCAVADALTHGAAPRWMWTHFPAGELRAKGTGGRLKAMGLQRGWPDFLLVDPVGGLHCLELKRGRAALKSEQARFKQACRDRGVPWALARSVEEAVAILSGWGALRMRVSA